MFFGKNRIPFWKNSVSIFVVLVLLGVTAYCLTVTGTAQAENGVAPAGNAFSSAPLNPEFNKYIADFKLNRVQKQTAGGHGLGFIPPPLDLSHMKGGPYRGDFPAAYDLRNEGKLTPVKDQGACGSCWAFATYASMESHLLPSQTWDFSENHLKNTHGFDWGPCQGGNQIISAAYLARWSGPVDEADDPYSPYDNTSPKDLPVKKHLQQAYFIPDRSGPLDNDAIKQAVMNYGAVFTSMYYNNYYYTSGNYTYYYNGSSYSNHAVAIVGWDDNFDRHKFKTTPPGDGAFIIKNSWGTGWGENGYFYISYYDSNVGTANVVYTAEPVTNYKDVYQYDPYGWVDSIGQSGGNNPTLWFANIFTAKASESLAAVSFYTASPNSKYEIYIYKDVASEPKTGTLAGTKTGTLPRPGYNTVKLNAPVSLTSGQKYSVVIKLTTPGYYYPCPVEYAAAGYCSAATSNPGESWASVDGSQWMDLYEIGFGNVCLKAFTTGSAGPTITVVSPGGGENWAAGSTQTIRWSYTGDPGPEVKIELLKGSNVFSTITSGTPIGSNGSGSYSWTIPESQPDGNDYKVKITSTTNSSYTASSVSSFTITGPGITVTYPNGGERWRAGTAERITWEYTGNAGSEVKIELLKGNTVVNTISSGTPIEYGDYFWVMPENQPPGNDYKIKITSTTNPSYTDSSDNDFTIRPSDEKLVLFIHDGSESYNHINDTSQYGYSILKDILENEKGLAVEEKNPIPITSSVLANYDIVVFASMFANREISQSEADALVDYVNEGGKLFLVGEWNYSSQWKNSFNKVGSAFGITSDYNQISDPTDYYQQTTWPVISDIRSHQVTEGISKFVLPSASSLTVHSPAVGVAYTDADANPSSEVVLAAAETDSGRVIAAIGDSNFLDNRFMSLYDNRTLASNIFDWLSGEPQPPATEITITSPNGEEDWVAGSTQTISWSYTGNPGAKVKIELLKGGNVDSTISSGTPIGNNGSGSYSWTIPEDQVPGNDYKIRITSTSESSYSDTSDNSFTISKSVTETIIGFDPAEITVYKNPADPYSDEFIVSVKISDLAGGQKILGFHDIIHFDPDLMEVVNVELLSDSFLNPVLFSDKEIDNENGKIEFTLARSKTDYPGSGGLVFKITLRAKEKGTAIMEHFIADLRDAKNQTLPVNPEDGTVDILSLIGDFTGDGTIDPQDLAIFNHCWKHKERDRGWDEKLPGVPGSPFKQADIGPATGTPPELNIEPDGVVNFDDLLVFAWMWNWASNTAQQYNLEPVNHKTFPSCNGCTINEFKAPNQSK